MTTIASHHRDAWPAELDLMAQLASLRLRERWGDWSRAPFAGEKPPTPLGVGKAHGARAVVPKGSHPLPASHECDLGLCTRAAFATDVDP